MQFLADVPMPTPPSNLPTGPSSLAAAINNLFTFGLWAIGVAAVVMIAYTGLLYITSSGRPDRVKFAFQSVIYIAVGFGIVLLARSIVETIIPIAQKPDVPGIVSGGITLLMWVIGVAATIMVIISGMFYITSAGDPGRSKAAKDTLLYAVIGLAIAILGGTVITFLKSQFGF